MDEAYDAITREGYDLDDALCSREITMHTADHGHSASVECGMNIDLSQIEAAFVQKIWGEAGKPAEIGMEMDMARVIAVIEPVKPALNTIEIA